MLSKISTMMAVNMFYAKAATPGKTIDGTLDTPSGYPLGTPMTTPDAYPLFKGGYDCIRSGYYWTFPGTNGSGTPPTALSTTASATIRSFYPTTEAMLGTAQVNAIGEAAASSGCTAASTAIGNNAIAWGTSALITNRVVYHADAVYATNIAASVLLSIDFVLAATFQAS